MDHLDIDFKNAISSDGSVFQGQKYRISILTERLVRLEYSEEGIFFDGLSEQILNRNFKVPDFEVEQDEKILIITTKYFRLKYVKERPFIGSKIAPFSNLEIKLTDTDKSWYYNHPEARNFQTTGSGYNEKNNRFETTRGLYSVDGFASIDDSKTMMFTNDGYLVRPIKDRIDTYVFMYKRDFGLCLRDYFSLTGTPSFIPRYALGVWWNRDEIYHYNDIRELVGNFNRNQIPISIFLLGEFWHLKDKEDITKLKTGYTFNRNLIPDPNLMTKYLHDRGIHIGLQIDPTEGIMPHEDAYNQIKNNLGLASDVTIPFQVFDKFFLSSYFDSLIKPLINTGIDFFSLDIRNDDNALRALTYYHMKDCEKDNSRRSLIIAKNGSVAAHRYSVQHSGETIVAWDTLKQIPYYNSLASNKGLSFWSHDIAGYKDGMEDSELYTRYVQLATFSPIFRFSSKRGHYYKREPWRWDAKTLSIASQYTQLRHRLIPYLYTESYKYHQFGISLIQPLYYQIPFIYDEPDYKNEYYFGSELLVAPITVKKDTIMNRAVERIYLPKGVWYDFKTGKKFLGDKRYIVFFKDEDYPVFAKNGSIIILGDLKDNKNITTNPNSLEVHIFPGESNTYTLYEDDGVTNMYQEGYYIKTNFDYNYLQNNYTLIIRPIEGKTGIIPNVRDYKIRFRNTRESEDVSVYLDSKKIEFEQYIEDTDFVIKLINIPTTSQVTINCKGKDIEIDAVRIINEEIDSIIGDLSLETKLKEMIADIIFGSLKIDKKRIQIRKLGKYGVDKRFIKMFLKLIEYASEL